MTQKKTTNPTVKTQVVVKKQEAPVAKTDAQTGATGTTQPAVETQATEENKEATVAALRKLGAKALSRTPVLKMVYVTTDGTVFAAQNDAENHAKSLNDKIIIIVKGKINE